MRIAWVARDGYIDLFPAIAKKLQQDCGIECFYLCHTEDEAAYLLAHYQIKATVLAHEFKKYLLTDNLVPAALTQIMSEYTAIPLVRCFWSSRFEMEMAETKIQRESVAQIKFWQDYLTKNHIQALFYERPSILSSCLAWLVCQKFGVQSLDFIDTPVDTITTINNWYGDFVPQMDENMGQVDKTTTAYHQAISYLQQMQNKPVKTKEALTTAEITRKRGQISLTRLKKLWGKLKHYKKRRQFYLYDLPVSQFLFKHVRYWLKFKYHQFINVFDSINLQDKFFLYPLHMMGEWSNHIWMRLDYWDVVNHIKHIAQCLPPGYKLYVKEHYSMFAERPLKFYKALKKIPHVVLVPPNAETFALIPLSSGICTAGSTLGFEAMLMDKPVILVGDVWYRNVAGIHKADTAPDLAYLLQHSAELPRASHEEKLALIYALYKIGVKAVKAPRENYLHPDNINALAQLVQKQLVLAVKQAVPAGVECAVF